MTEILPIVTIVIPTHNRSKYAIASVSGIMKIESDFIQVVVHDTSNDDCALKQWAEKQQDKRLLYRHSSKRLSMTENHERALDLATGEYVCLIGDDDSVSNQIIRVARFAQRKNIDVLTPSVKATYSWPDFKTKLYGTAHAGRVYLDEFSGEITRHESRLCLLASLKNACQGTDELPKIYHGLVRRALIDKIRDSYGRVFWGSSPDMSGAIALALATEHFYCIDLPFTIPGASGGSNTGRSAMRKHKGHLSGESHINTDEKNSWPQELPNYFSVQTVWANAAWCTFINSNASVHLVQFNLARLYALCLFSELEYYKDVKVSQGYALEHGLKYVTNLDIVKEFFVCLFKAGIKKSRRLFNPGPSNGKKIVAVVDDVSKARIEIDAVLMNHPNFMALEDA